MTTCCVRVFGCDWTRSEDEDAAAARAKHGARIAFQGNLDPAVLLAPPESVRVEARRVLDAFGSGPGHVFNLGHGISQHASVESVSALVDEVRAYSERMRRSAQKKA